jgi:hypothetical protein
MLVAMRALVVLVLLTACGGRSSDESYKPVAIQFAKHLVARDFAAAHALLAMPMTREQLEQSYDQMIAPIGKVSDAQIMQTMTDWPDKQANDAGWAYVAIAGELGSEAVTVVVTRDRKIRSIEFGRP